MNTLSKTVATVFGSVLLVGGLAVSGAAPAFAHTPEVLPSCDSLALTLTSYTVIAAEPASGGAPAVVADSTPNSVTVTVDGVASTEKFGTSYKKTIPLDGTAAHTYSVVLDAHDAYDWSASGSTVACVTPPPTTPPTTPPPTTPPTTPPPTTPPPVATPPAVTPPVVTPPTTPLVPTPLVEKPPVASTPVPSTPPTVVTPRVTATELAETGAPPWTVPGLIGAFLAVVLGAGLLLTRGFRRA